MRAYKFLLCPIAALARALPNRAMRFGSPWRTERKRIVKFLEQIKRPCYIALIFAVLLTACASRETESKAIQKALGEKYGVNIDTIKGYDQLPKSVRIKMRQGRADIRMTPPTKAQYASYLRIVKTALQKYPISVIKKHLKTIYIGGQYSENGGVIAGMYEDETLYLFYNSVKDYTSDTFLEQTFHHEFSSILIYQYNFPAFDWLRLNPKGFAYIINASKFKDYMNSRKSYGASETQLRQGLVSSYGQTNAENDINSYAEMIFTQPGKTKKLIEKYPRIGLKYEMIKRFYLSISPEFKSIFDQIR